MEKNLAIISHTNRSAVDDLIKRYRQSTKEAIEGILCMGEAVFEIYTKAKAKELTEADLDYFCKSVNLDMKSSTFRKYKAIGQNANRFRGVMDKLPATFSVLYEMATLSGDDFERLVMSKNYSKSITLDHFKKMMHKSAILTKNKMFNPQVLKCSNQSVAKAIKGINRFSISLVRNVPESKYDEFVDTLTEYRNEGWLQFDEPDITNYLTQAGEQEFNEKLLQAQLTGDYSELAEI